jgi:uncharacterized protein (TIGR03437 family)
MSPIALVVLSFQLLFSVAQAQVSITTYRNNLARSGENLNEIVLTPANVNAAQFGKIFSHSVDGQIYAQPLYLPAVKIPGRGIHNVVFVATEHNSVYAFDADSAVGPNSDPLWQVSLTDPKTQETVVTPAEVMNCFTITPELGITGTPVIDPSTNTLYVVAMTKRDYLQFHRLHAIDVTTGAERAGSPIMIEASYPGNGDGLFSSSPVKFDSYFHKNRSGLLLLNGVVYAAWTSHCDSRVYHGWITAYDAKDLHQVAVFNSTPNANRASFWMGGAAPAADAEGNVYAVSGDGQFDPPGSNFGDSVIKFSSSGLTVIDYFTPFNQLHLGQADLDLGSSGALLLPDSVGSPEHRHLLICAGKEGRIYLLDRDRMGQFNTVSDSQIVQSVEGAISSLYGGPAYFNQTVYFAASNDRLKAFRISGARLETAPSSQSAQAFSYPGAVPAVSANGSANGIIWLTDSSYGGTLRAFDASNLTLELYNSRINASRDGMGPFVRFSTPVIANGKVYAGTGNSLAVYGLLTQASPTSIVNAASFATGPVAPGSLISIFGSNLANGTDWAPAASLPSGLGGTTVWINGAPAPLEFVSPTQINAQVPFGAPTGPASAVLQLMGMPPVSMEFSIVPAAPGIFTNGRNQASVQNADGSFNTPENPASAGSRVSVYLTGLGIVAPPVSDGEPASTDTPARAVYPVTARIGQNDVSVSFAGLSPRSVGVYQVDLVAPTIGDGLYPLVVTVNGVPSNMARISISTSPQ